MPLPQVWYNIIPDLPKPLPPPRDPEIDSFSRIELLPKLFPHNLLDQEFSAERFIRIPSEILEVYRKIGRPTPLVRAKGLERYLETPGNSPRVPGRLSEAWACRTCRGFS